nr:hypothetical protein [Tanacetum cinerariifolium]
MFNQPEDIQAANSDTRPPMLDMTDFKSWQPQFADNTQLDTGRQNRVQGNNARGAIVTGNRGAQNKADLDEEQLFFLTGGQTNTFDADVDDGPTMFMANLYSADPVYDEAYPSYDSDILSKYVQDNEEQVVQSDVSFVSNDALMMIINATSSDAPAFDSVFVIGELEEQLQRRGNTIRELKEKISRLTKKNNEAHPILDFKALDSQNKDLTMKVNSLQDLNEHFRAENEKTTSLLDEIKNLKAQLKGKMKCVTMPAEKPNVLALGMYAIDVEHIPPRNRNNREVNLDYLTRLKESVRTLCEIVEEARITQPLDNALKKACRVLDATAASGSKPRSNTKKVTTLPAKSDKKNVEVNPRNTRFGELSRLSKSGRQLENCLPMSIISGCPLAGKFTLGEQCPLTRLNTSSHLNAACKKALNLLKKGLLIRKEAVKASKRRRSLLDHKIQ